MLYAFSPIKYDKKALETIGKKLKKNSVALDIIDFGEDEDGKPEKLEALLSSVNNNDSSHIVHAPPSQNALSDVLIRFYLASPSDSLFLLSIWFLEKIKTFE